VDIFSTATKSQLCFMRQGMDLDKRSVNS